MTQTSAWGMPSSGTLRRVVLVRTDVAEERNATIIRVARIGEVGTTLAVSSNRRTLRRNTSISGRARILRILRSVLRLLVTADVPSSALLVTLVMKALRSSKTSVLTRATQRNIAEVGIFHGHRRENLKSYIPLNFSNFDDCLMTQPLWSSGQFSC
jgi:hypothetical protein